ncbi:MAG: transcription termination factor Rho [Proteobacteria bacterium]|nr:MAG: transcription termination factor Rho [Pseudomonadota bacterium]
MTDAPLQGVLHIPDERKDGHFRDPANLLRPIRDVFLPRRAIQDLRLRPGVKLTLQMKGRQVTKIMQIEDQPVDRWRDTVSLYEDIAIDPQPQIKLEHSPTELTTRAVDILTPIGFGTRGLIVAPPRTGKTMLLQNLARGIHHNYCDTKWSEAEGHAPTATLTRLPTPSGKPAELVLLLVDERPEEVTDMRRNVPGTVHASSNDNTLDKHLELSQLVIERCKRRAEYGYDVIILLDSLTRLGRAFNIDSRSGKTLSGGMDSRAMEVPKKLFGAARKIEKGGSLTIIATCLVDTGSKMDQVIFEEFKGTGNMELTLDRKVSDNRIYPALNIPQSGTRKEELLLAPDALACNRVIRRHLVDMPPVPAMKSLLDTLTKVKTNQQVYNSMQASVGLSSSKT